MQQAGDRRVLVADLDTQCNASLMLVGGEGWDKARRAGRTIADYFFDRFEKVAEDESEYVLKNIGDVAHARNAPGRVSLLPGSLLLEDVQGELFLMLAKKDLHADAISVQVRGRMKRMIKHFGMAKKDDGFTADKPINKLLWDGRAQVVQCHVQ